MAGKQTKANDGSHPQESEAKTPQITVEKKAAFWAKKPSELLKDWVDVLSKVAQIIALTAAGFWAILLFSKETEPGLVPRVNVDVGLNWTAPDASNKCRVDMTVTVKNPGKSSITINNVVIRMWLADLPAERSAIGAPSFIDFWALRNTKPFLESGADTELLRQDLLGDYSPDDSNASEQVAIVPYTKNKLAGVLARVEFRESGIFHWGNIVNYGYADEPLCEPRDPKNSHQAATPIAKDSVDKAKTQEQ